MKKASQLRLSSTYLLELFGQTQTRNVESLTLGSGAVNSVDSGVCADFRSTPGIFGETFGNFVLSFASFSETLFSKSAMLTKNAQCSELCSS